MIQFQDVWLKRRYTAKIFLNIFTRIFVDETFLGQCNKFLLFPLPTTCPVQCKRLGAAQQNGLPVANLLALIVKLLLRSLILTHVTLAIRRFVISPLMSKKKTLVTYKSTSARRNSCVTPYKYLRREEMPCNKKNNVLKHEFLFIFLNAYKLKKKRVSGKENTLI